MIPAAYKIDWLRRQVLAGERIDEDFELLFSTMLIKLATRHTALYLASNLSQTPLPKTCTRRLGTGISENTVCLFAAIQTQVPNHL